MATLGDDWLKIQLGSSRGAVDAEAYLDVFQRTLRALKAIDKQASSSGVAAITWQVVDAGSNSPVFATIRGEQSNGADGRPIIEAFVSGLAALQHSHTCPRLFNKDALIYTSELIRSFARGITTLSFSTASKTIDADRRIASNANYAVRELQMRKRHYFEYGMIEGQLRELGVSRTRDRLGIVDPLTGQQTLCYLRNEQLESLVREAWKCRVRIEGKIKVDRDTGIPMEVDVESIEILRERSELPQIDDLRDIDITGGVESSEYIKDLRDAN